MAVSGAWPCDAALVVVAGRRIADAAECADAAADGAAEDEADVTVDTVDVAPAVAARRAASAVAFSSSRRFHVLWTACWLFLESFCHSVSGMLGGRNDPRNGLLKMRLPRRSYLYQRPMRSCR